MEVEPLSGEVGHPSGEVELLSGEVGHP